VFTCVSFASLSGFYLQQLAALLFQAMLPVSAVVSLLHVTVSGCEQRLVSRNMSTIC